VIVKWGTVAFLDHLLSEKKLSSTNACCDDVEWRLRLFGSMLLLAIYCKQQT